MQAQDMTREKQINFRVSDEEIERFERVAAHFGIPVAAMVRMLVKREEEAIREKKRLLAGHEDDFRWEKQHGDVLDIVSGEKDPITTSDIGLAICSNPYFYNATWGGLGLTLNQLTRNGYLRRVKTGYRVTDKGRAAGR